MHIKFFDMKTKATAIILFLLISLCASAQTQYGVVKTKGRLGVNGSVIPGKNLSGAKIVVKGRNAVLSGASGSFSFPIPGQKYYLQSATKQGYVLVDMDVLSKQYAYSKDNPLCIVMETPDVQEADRRAAESKIMRSLRKTLRQREDEIEELREQNKITAEEYQKRLQELYSAQENSVRLVSEMAERYSKTDYDQLDEFNRRVGELILNGELVKADSLIRSKGDFNTRLAELKLHQEANDKERKVLAQRQENLSKSEAYAQKQLEDLAQDSYHRYEIFSLNFQNDSAAYYLKFRAELDTTNVAWQLHAGCFIGDYLADYDLAMQYCQRALRCAVQQHGDTHPDVATSHNNIGIVYALQGAYLQALEYYNKALDIQLKTLGDTHPDVATSYNNIGSVYDSQGSYSEALEYYNKSLEISLKTLGDTHPNVATCYNNIGYVYNSQGAYSQALEYYNKSLEIWLNTFGDTHPDVAASYNNIGQVYTSQGTYSQALEYYNKSLEIWLNTFGDTHPNVAASYNNIGYVYFLQGSYPQALENYIKSLEILLSVYGDTHPNVAASYNNIGQVYSSQGFYSQALEYLKKALDIILNTFGDTHPNVAASYNNIGSVYDTQGAYSQALEYYNKALEILLNTFGDTHPNVATCYNNIGGVYYNQGAYPQALMNFTKDLEINLKVLGDTHPDVADSYDNIGYIYYLQGSYSQAFVNYNKALEIYRKLYGDTNAETVQSLLEVYQICMQCVAKDKSFDVKQYQSFMSEVAFTATPVEEDSAASRQGMSGEYYLIEFEDWNQDAISSLFAKDKEFKGKPKTIVVMKDGVISKHYFENTMGIQLSLKFVSKDEKARIAAAYKKWKQKNK